MAKKEETKEVKTNKCCDCKTRNNKTNDRKAGDGGTGWCASHKKYVARKSDACVEFKVREKQKMGKKRIVAEEVEEEKTEVFDAVVNVPASDTEEKSE